MVRALFSSVKPWLESHFVGRAELFFMSWVMQHKLRLRYVLKEDHSIRTAQSGAAQS